MATKQPLKTTFDVEHVIRPIFTGGSIAIDNEAQILATTLGEDVVLTNPANGKHLAQIEGVRELSMVDESQRARMLTCLDRMGKWFLR